MTKVHLILGNITFLDVVSYGKLKAIVHRIDQTLEFDNPELAEKNGELYLDRYESYLVPDLYKGEIEWAMDDYRELPTISREILEKAQKHLEDFEGVYSKIENGTLYVYAGDVLLELSEYEINYRAKLYDEANEDEEE